MLVGRSTDTSIAVGRFSTDFEGTTQVRFFENSIFYFLRPISELCPISGLFPSYDGTRIRPLVRYVLYKTCSGECTASCLDCATGMIIMLDSTA